jgi:hypothetical protein
MTEHTAATDQSPRRMSAQEHEYDLARLRIMNSSQYIGRMIWTITLVAGGISVIVVLSVVIIAITAMLMNRPGDIPDVLSNWGGIILGFYFGQFVNLVKDFMGVVSGVSTPSQGRTG